MDGSRFDEHKPVYGPSLLTGWASIHGYPVGILANARGVLFGEESQKAQQFIQLANQTDTPLVFLQNTTGYMVGTAYEQAGIIRDGALMINAVSNSRVPHLTVVMGASYGAGNYGMCGRAYDPRFLFSWPGAKSAVMGPAQLAGVLSIVARQAAAARGQDYDEAGDEAMRRAVEEQIEAQSVAFAMSGRLYDDGVIDPRDTRTVLGLCLSAVHSSSWQGTRGYGVFRSEVAARDRATAGGQPRGDRPAGDPDLPVARDLARRGALHCGRSAAPGSPRPTPRSSCPARRRRRPTCEPTCWSTRPGGPAPTRCTPATGSWPRTPGSPGRCSTRGWSGSGRHRRRSPSMGSKVDAKALVAAAGVPVLPSWTPGEVPADARYPLLVKASYGGGGRGMRIVRAPGELADAVAAARAGGGGRLRRRARLRRALAGAVPARRGAGARRHATGRWSRSASGTARCSAGTRRSSRRRRPALPDALRQRLFEAAVAAARSVGYVGAGTVEFLVDADGEPAFLEMNTRLQVEHPVTEAVTGLDLVALQLSIAEGAPLPFDAPPPVRGHAIEARLYAEDPAAGWRPSTGTLHRIAVPGDVRVDAGVVDGDDVSAALRPDAGQGGRARRRPGPRPPGSSPPRWPAPSCTGSRPTGTCWCGCCGRTGSRPAPHTGFLDEQPELVAPLAGPAEVATAALVAALAGSARRRATAPVQRTVPAGWRNNPSQPATATYAGPDGEVTVDLPAGAGDRSRAPPRTRSCWSTDGVRGRVPGARGRRDVLCGRSRSGRSHCPTWTRCRRRRPRCRPAR